MFATGGVGAGGPQLRGADLERRVERFFALHGYSCRRNVVVQGRSGAGHEIDVLAEKTDAVTTFSVVVECKAWSRPVDKDVVAKVAFVMADLGIHKGVVVALEGWRAGAEWSAAELGVELWGPAELEERLGQVALADLRAGPARRLVEAFPLRLSVAEAQRLVEKQRRRRFGPGRETVEWVELVWIPHHLVEIVTTRPEGGFLERRALQSTWRWNLYEAVTGRFLGSRPERPSLAGEDALTTIPPAVTAARVVSAIRQAIRKRAEVVTPAAQARYDNRLAELGIPAGVTAVTVESSGLVHVPVYLGLLRRTGGARFVAVDGNAGVASPEMTAVFTGAMGYVLQALEQAPTG